VGKSGRTPPSIPSAGEGFQVPNLKGRTLPAAKGAMARANCRVGKIRRDYSKTVKRDRVILVKPKLGAGAAERRQGRTRHHQDRKR
jgi:beta-lactam-binding protein with PASTA domain